MSLLPSNTNVGVLAVGIYPSLGALRSAPPPLVERFAHVFGTAGTFVFVPLDPSTDDGETVIVPNAGGGAWRLEGINDRGTDLAPGSHMLGVYDGEWLVIEAGTLTGDVVYTLDPTGAELGYGLEITRLDVSAYTVTVVDGGPAATTLSVMPGGSKCWGFFWFTGTDYLQRRGGVMPRAASGERR